MKEWSESNKLNPMNSLKGLVFYEHFKKILGWMDGKNELPAPVEASLDPTNACQQHCFYCSSNQYLNDKSSKRWGIDYMQELFEHLAEWGVKGYCWGGREATLNIRLAEATRYAHTCGLEGAIVTNGIYLPDDLLDALMLLRWIGVSVDSTSPEIYKKVRGTDDCEKVWQNIGRLANKKQKTDVDVRALVLPETIDTLYDTCYRAREVGATCFHSRPADLQRKDLKIAQTLNLNMDRVAEIFDKCHELETKDFHVYTVVHKFDSSFKAVHRFKRCLAAPIVMQLCCNKRKYICVDHRLDARYEVKEWGSQQHLDLINSIVPDRDCSRCTWATYNQIISEVVINDSMEINFP